MGEGGQITMTVIGKKIAEGRLKRTIPVQFSRGESVDIGMDTGSPVEFTYQLPFAFTGTIEKVTIQLAKLGIAPANQKAAKIRETMRVPPEYRDQPGRAT